MLNRDTIGKNKNVNKKEVLKQKTDRRNKLLNKIRQLNVRATVLRSLGSTGDIIKDCGTATLLKHIVQEIGVHQKEVDRLNKEIEGLEKDIKNKQDQIMATAILTKHSK